MKAWLQRPTTKVWLNRLIDFALYAALAVMLAKFVSRKLSGPGEGSLAASFDLPLVGDNAGHFRLDEHRGKPVLVEVFASWCGACRRSAPTLADAYRQRAPSGVEFIGVSVDGSREDAARVKKAWNLPYDVAVDDGRVVKSYDIQVLPTLMLIGKDGRVRHVSTGAPSASELNRWFSEL